MNGENAKAFADIKEAIKQDGFLENLQEFSPSYHALTRDTCSLTMLQDLKKLMLFPQLRKQRLIAECCLTGAQMNLLRISMI
jgi:hypothetical protein